MPSIVRHCTAVLAYLLVLRTAADIAPWYFLPNFGEDIRGVERVAAGRFHETIPGVAERLLSPDGGLSPDQREQVRWHEATFPHRGFVDMMPQQKAFGWYAHAFGVPQQFTGLDLLLDLGIIDDADETFVNGVRVGGIGKVPGGPPARRNRVVRQRIRRQFSRRPRVEPVGARRHRRPARAVGGDRPGGRGVGGRLPPGGRAAAGRPE